jgi:BirA family biotin operon repressor/biotin-[acetyl-CoA-carboxylase] ligase
MTTRPPLDQNRLQPLAPWTRIVVADELDSTNSAIADEPTGTVLVAEHQVAGRGRLDRSWVAPPRAGLTFSVIVAPTAPTSSWGWLPLLTGLALTDAIDGAVLKWPNDVLIGPRRAKIAGILAQSTGDRVIIGVGLNVSTTRAELPVDTASSIELEFEGPGRDRTELLAQLLETLGRRYQQWDESGGRGPLADYRAQCVTIGQPVRVHGVDGSTLDGVAIDVDDTGRLVVEADGGRHLVAAGDVEHVRPATE